MDDKFGTCNDGDKFCMCRVSQTFLNISGGMGGDKF